MSRVGKQYAEALFDLATDQGRINEVAKSLRLASVLLESPEVKRLLAHPAIPAREKMETIAELLPPETEATALNLLELLVGKGRIAFVPDIAWEYQRLLDRETGVLHVEIHSPRSLSHEETEDIRKALEETWNRTLRLSTSVDPDLLGGMALRIGDLWLDGSLVSQLDRLKRELRGMSI